MSAIRCRRWPAMLAAAMLVPVLLLGSAAPAFAAAPTYSQWRVALWPEYDDQRTLVIYEPRLDDSVQLPFGFSYADFPIDAQMGMTCQVKPTGEHECQQSQTNVGSDAKTVSYSVPSQRQLYMEYYSDMLGGQRPEKRKMTYKFKAPADIADLQIGIKRPKDAKDFTVTPKPVTQQTDSDGYTIDTFGMQNVKAGQEYTFTFEYSRPTWDPPVAKAQNNGAQGAAAGAGASGQAPASSSSQTIALVAIAAIMGAFVMFVMRKRPAAAPVVPVERTGGAKKGSSKTKHASGGTKGASGSAGKKSESSAAKPSGKRKGGGSRRPADSEA